MLAERQHDEARAALNIRRVHVERQKSSARVLAQQERERGADSGVGETGQRLSCCDDVPNAADVRKRNQERGFALGATKRRHEIRLVLVASRDERLNERVERFARATARAAGRAAAGLPGPAPTGKANDRRGREGHRACGRVRVRVRASWTTTHQATRQGDGALRPAQRAAAHRLGSQRALRSFKTRSAGASD